MNFVRGWRNGALSRRRIFRGFVFPPYARQNRLDTDRKRKRKKRKKMAENGNSVFDMGLFLLSKSLPECFQIDVYDCFQGM